MVLETGRTKKGKVYLVGAGPGDPSLITVRGRDVLAKADVVFYDYLANEQLLSHAPPRVEKVFVGKKGGAIPVPQQEIERRMIEAAEKGRVVVRLKGGDPFIFGRGGEEAVALSRAGIVFEVVPGVSSAIGVPAFAGIPLTHRELSSEVVLVTGHQEGSARQGDAANSSDENDNESESRIHWDALSKIGTLVFLMSTENLRWISQRLIAFGRSRDTPAAIISWGTYPSQKTVVGSLGTLPDLASEEQILPPSVLVIGEVVRFREKLNWFESRPLFKKRILLTRTQEQSSEIRKRLEELGATVFEFPTIEILPPKSFRSLDRAIRTIRHYDWIFFTSVNGVSFFWDRLIQQGLDSRALHGTKIGAIGSQTAEKLRSFGIQVDLIPQTFSQEGIVAMLDRFHIRKKRILIPRAKVAREVLPRELKKRGCRVEVVEAYRTVLPKYDPVFLRELFEKKKPQWVVFASSQTVTNFVGVIKKAKLAPVFSGLSAACIGPITAKTARRKGLHVELVPEESTMENLVQALAGHA